MNVLHLYNKLSKVPLGKRMFSWFFCFKAPYFNSVKPLFLELKPGHCMATLKKRRAVLNHIGTVHAIAMCNLAEAVGGLCVEASLPRGLRWIPKGMKVEYLQKATSDLKCSCNLDVNSLKPGSNFIDVGVFDQENVKVLSASIEMYVSEKKK